MIEVPAYGLAQARLELLSRLPTQFTGDLGGVDGVAAIVARAVGDKCDQLAARTGSQRPCHLIHEVANQCHHVQVGALARPANVVGRAHPAAGQDRTNRRAVILHKEPVADVLPVAVNRQRFAFKRVQDHQRDEFFRKLVRAVVVRTVGCQRGQSKGVLIGPDQVIRASLGCGIGAVGCVRCGLAEGWVSRTERAINLVG